MTERVPKNTWVEVHGIVLKSDDRAPQVPADTQRVPLEMKTKGLLRHAAAVGDEVEIVTPSGRICKGTLSAFNPAYTHQFGAPVAELLSIGSEVRAILRGKAS